MLTGQSVWRAYKVAWVGGCVLFDVAALRSVGGWDFWPQLPAASRAEDVVVQLRVDKKSRGSRLRFVVLDALARPRMLEEPGPEPARGGLRRGPQGQDGHVVPVGPTVTPHSASVAARA